MMFGYATSETPELMPLPISIAHALTKQAAEVRRKHPNLGLRPDVKSQVSVEYDKHWPTQEDRYDRGVRSALADTHTRRH